MATKSMAPKRSYGIRNPLQKLYPLPIIAQRAPTVNDRAEIGTIWLDQNGNDIYIIMEVVAGASNWVPIGAGAGVFDSVTSTTFVTAGTTVAAGTTVTAGTGLIATAGTVTCTAMAATGVITNTAAGVFVSQPLATGEIIIGSVGVAPVAARLTAGAGIAIDDLGVPGAITITATGATAVQYTCNDANVAVPDGVGNVNVLGVVGGNITTVGAVANTVGINTIANPTFAGLVTCNLGVVVAGANATITSATNAGQDIYLHANGGIAETIDIYSQLGTGVDAAASVYLHSEVGGITIDGGIAAANAIRFNASDAVGGIDIDSGAGGFDVLTNGAISMDAAADSNITVTGAFDLDLNSTLGSVVVTSGEAVADAVQLTASNAAGGITAAAGTGGITLGATNGDIAITSGTGDITVGTDAAEHTVTVGSITVASRTVIQSGNGNVAITSTDDITIDAATGLFSIDSIETSNITVTGASEDLQLYAVGGSVVIDGSEAAATAVSINASDGAGGVTIAAGTGGLLFGNQADCTTIDLGNFAPTAARTITIGGGTVVTAAVTDTIDIGPDGATTNANSIKTVNINTGGVTLGEVLTHIATGAITSGTHTVNIQTGNAAAGTVATNVSTGTGTKTVNVGNADGLTTVNIDAITLINDSIDVATSINTGTSTGAVAIGNALAGAMTIDTAAGISLDAATASNFTVTGAADLTLQSTLGGVDLISGLAAADAIVLNASDAAGGMTVTAGTGGIISTITNGVFTVTTGTGQVDISADATANTLNIGTGAGVKTVTLGSGNTTSITAIDCGTAGLTLGTTANEHTTTIGSATTASSIVCQSGTGAAEFGANATDHTTTIGSVIGTSETTIQAGTGAFTCTANGAFDVNATGAVTIDSSGGTLGLGEDAVNQNINIGTAGTRTIAIGSAAATVTIDSGAGDISLTSTDDIYIDATGNADIAGAAINLDATGGALSATAATGTVAGVALTLDARVGRALFTGQTPAAAAAIDFDVTNAFAAAGKTILVTMAYSGAADADITIEGVNLATAGHIIVHCRNNGPAQGDGDIQMSWWILD